MAVVNSGFGNRRGASDARLPPGQTLVGGTWTGWQREFDVEGGTAPAGSL